MIAIARRDNCRRVVILSEPGEDTVDSFARLLDAHESFEFRSGARLVNHSWTCRCCGKQFNSLPLDFACRAPDYYFEIPAPDREQRAKLDSDVCIIDNEHIFVRGCLEVPIIDHDDCFMWGLWVSLSRTSFERVWELWDLPVIENESPKFGWLSNNLSLYPATLNLKTNLHLRGGGNRPFIELEPTDHPLAIEQRQGITISRVEEIIAAISPRH